MKTDLQVIQNSTEIASAYMLLLTQKSLMKTESLSTQKLSTQHISTVDAKIISAHRLLLTQKSFMKTELLSIQNHQCNTHLRLMMKSSAHIGYY
jgi:hypothetical protein